MACWNQAVEQYGAVIGTDHPDLTRFRARGGKVIILHGTADQLIPHEGSIDYYERVQRAMGGAERTAEFVRLFLMPALTTVSAVRRRARIRPYCCRRLSRGWKGANRRKDSSASNATGPAN